MPQDPIFACADVALLRAAVRPRRHGGHPGRDPGPDDAGPEAEQRWLHGRLTALAADELLVEAVEGASRSLVHDVLKVARGEPVKAKELRRSTLSLTKYQLRMASRPTPFGLFAGIAPVRVGDGPAPRVGTAHTTVSRPDAAWLDAVLDQVRDDPSVLAGAVLVANEVRAVRDGRLVLPERYDEAGARRPETSIRYTALVREVLAAAEAPIGWARLVEHLRRRFGAGGGSEPGRLEAVLRQLVRTGVLLTDLDPPPDCTDPLDHVLSTRTGRPHPVFGELRAVRDGLRAADAGTPGERWARTRAVVERMRTLHDTANLVQTDLRLDVEATLPAEVAREAERAAGVLWRLGGVAGPPWLPGYHARFVERYGSDRVVPVLELLDETLGLGLPPGYRTGVTGRGEVPGASAEPRQQLLGEELMAALRDGRDEVVLDDDLVDRLAGGPPPGRRPASMELCVELVADGWDSLRDGAFRLVIGENLGSSLAGATVARFAHLLPELDDELAGLACLGAPAGGARAAQVACRPRAPRSANLASVPQRLALRIPVGAGPAATHATDLPLDRLAIGAGREGLYLYDTAGGARIAPVSGSMLDPRSGHIPPVARFLLELGEQDTPACLPWSWGSLARLPYLPRVRYGRTVLAPARWLPGREMLDATDAPWDRWRALVHAWRDRWNVPDQVQLTTADNRIAIDLDDPLHLRVLQQELRRAPRPHVQEVPARREDHGWLRGPDGAHATEIVLQLLPAPVPAPAASATGPARPAAATRPRLSPQRPSDLLQMPGGEWLYAKLYASETAQRQLLRSHLAELVDPDRLAECGVDDWFYLRYSDPDPHLRVRFHGKPDELCATLLPYVHAWSQRMRRAGLLSRWALDSYDPEAERYGGADVMSDAERVFHADSRVGMGVVPLLVPDRVEPEPVAALSVLRLLTHFGHAGELLDLLAALVPLAERRAVSMARRAELAGPIAPGGRTRGQGAVPEQAALEALWSRRDDAVAAYRTALLAAGCAPHRYREIGASLAHMHCNRLFGVDRERERAIYALLHGALAVRANRERHGR